MRTPMARVPMASENRRVTRMDADLSMQADLLKDEKEAIATPLIGLTKARMTLGFGRWFLHLRSVKGHAGNHNRVYPLAVR